jgi:phosphoribosylglycinamide formyltransferase 2
MKLRKSIGTPLFDGATKIVLLGSGELGKEIVIEAQRLGVETITVDRYDNPPAAQVAHKHYTVDMRDSEALKAIVRRERPDAVIPEIEAINTDALVELEEEGFFVVPKARATKITMDRILLRKLAAEEAKVPTSDYAFAENMDELYEACEKIGYPCVVKARMSSGGLGSSVVFGRKDVAKAYEISKKKARGFGEEVVVEGLIRFDFEITELVVAHFDEDGRIKLSFPKPIGHIRSSSHYHVSWQPFITINSKTGKSTSPIHTFIGKLHRKEDKTKSNLLWSSLWDEKYVDAEIVTDIENQIYDIAEKFVSKLIEDKGGLKGLGVFGCEMFVKISDEKRGGKPAVYFNETSPRPHDTGMVTFVTQDLSEAALHVRAVLGLQIPKISLLTPAAAHVILANKDNAWAPKYYNLDKVLGIPGVNLRLFGKPVTYTERRLGLALAISSDIEEARINAMNAAHMMERGIKYD